MSSVLLGLIALSFGLGLRHAVDADHIAAIDNTVRKLINEDKNPYWVGLFFSLGHSLVVIIISLILTLSASFINSLPSLERVGSVLGTIVSSLFLLIIGGINLRILFKSVKDRSFSGGVLSKAFKALLRSVDTSWKMAPVGFLFGLSFDTASEVGLLSISGVAGRSFTLGEVMLIPLSFTAGMVLVDSLDGILMLKAYGWASLQPNKKFYYNFTLTTLSIALALFIGLREFLSLFG